MKNLTAFNAALITLIFAVAFSFKSVAQKIPMYPVSDIPETLRENSNAVIREDITRYEVIEVGKAKSYTKKAITILNKKADDYAEVSIGYDKISKITSLSCRSYDKSGKLITQLKNKDIKDYSAFDGFSIYSDNRMKYFDLRYAEYPYTIEYEYEIQENGFMSFENWMPFTSFNISSQQSSLEIIYPENYKIRYIELNMEPSAKENSIDGKKVTSWEFGSFSAIEPEPRMPFLRKVLPTVLTAPSDFLLEGYEGNMNDWASFGLWEKNLNSGRDSLPAELTVKIKELVGQETSRTEIIRKIYTYLQSNTRYVSIQLGIGGWQTFPATDVASNGYGDCKALSNYMKSLLKSVDIESYYTLVKAGRNTSNIMKEFPSNQFNHMILCVPNYQDTIWLECTSQDNPFGYLGTFTGDRDVLVINETGGKIVHTPVYAKEVNRQIQLTQVDLKSDGSAEVNLSAKCSGLQYDNFSGLLDIGETEQKKWLYKNLDIPSFELGEYAFEAKKDAIPELTADISVSINHFASVSGKRIFIEPDVFNKSVTLMIPQKERKYEFVLNHPFEDIDTVKITVPQGFHLEHIPEKISMDSPFGQYEAYILAEEESIRYIRKFSLTEGTFPPGEYVNFIEFINKIADADKSRLVLVKAT